MFQFPYIEVLIVEVKGTDSNIQSKLTLDSTPRRGEDSQHDTAFGYTLNKVEFAHSPSEEVGTHLWSGVKDHFLHHGTGFTGHVSGGGLRHV